MKHRKDFKVDISRPPKIGEPVRMRAVPGGVIAGTGEVCKVRYDAFSGTQGVSEHIASCASAKALSDWAFRMGAWSVREDFDWKLADGEL